MKTIEEIKNSEQYKLLYPNGSYGDQIREQRKRYEENRDKYGHLTKDEARKFLYELLRSDHDNKDKNEIYDKYGVPHDAEGIIIVPKGEK